MRLADAAVEELLLKSGICTKKQITDLGKTQLRQRRPLQDIVVAENIVTDVELTKLYAAELKVPYMELASNNLSFDIVKRIPERIARQYNAILFGHDKGSSLIAMQDPEDQNAQLFLQKLLGNPIKVHVSASQDIQSILDLYRLQAQSRQMITSSNDIPNNYSDDFQILQTDNPVAETVTQILENGIRKGATDIHIEPHEQLASVRYRIDGVLAESNKLPLKLMPLLVAQIKHSSGMNYDERNTIQIGSCKIELDGRIYSLSVSTLPVIDGEKIAIHVIQDIQRPTSFKELGLWGSALTNVEHAVVQSQGLIVVTGPDGSGRSTTLFSLLHVLNSSSVNIATIEDPIEYRIAGVNQTQVNPSKGITFASGLRALLQQDTNIVMAGEVRDPETSTLAIQAAMSGRLVFGGMHALNACSCVKRFTDMQIAPYLTASTLRIIIAQRLARKLCVHCRESIILDQKTLKQLAHDFQLKNIDSMKKIHILESEAFEEGLGRPETSREESLSTSPSTIRRIWKANTYGCTECNYSGYKGRIGIFEVLLVDDSIQKHIVNNATSAALDQAAKREGLIPLRIDGLVKILRGLTSVEEIMHIVDR
jgi:type IV pilus assembly protein PilB